MLGEIKVRCARTAPSRGGNPIVSCVRRGFNVEYLLPEHRTLGGKPGHGRGRRGDARGGPRWSPSVPTAGWWMGIWPQATRPLCSPNLRVWKSGGWALVPFGSFLISKSKRRDKRERRVRTGGINTAPHFSPPPDTPSGADFRDETPTTTYRRAHACSRARRGFAHACAGAAQPDLGPAAPGDGVRVAFQCNPGGNNEVCF